MSSASTSRLRRFSLFAFAFAIAFVVLGSVVALHTVTAAGSMPVTGYAWSPFMGWISFSGPLYGVFEDTVTGALSGYAWSSNFGWISFNVSDAGHPVPQVNLSTGDVSGWVRACAAFADKNTCSGTLDDNSGAWDGWIALSGTALDGAVYGITQSPTCIWTGYAWGSDAIGAISVSGTAADGSVYGVVGSDPALCTKPTATLSASPDTINEGQSSTLTWSSQNATSCTGTGFSTGSPPNTSGNTSTGALNTPGTQNYQVVCTGTAGDSLPDFASVEVVVPNATISANPARVVSGNPTTLTWSAEGVESCVVSGPSIAPPPPVSGNADSNNEFSIGSPRSGVVINAQSTFTITCQADGPEVTASVVVNIQPSFEEF